MTTAEIIILVIGASVLILVAVLLWLTVRRRPTSDAGLTLLQSEVHGLHASINNRLDHFSGSFADVKEGVGEIRERSRRLSELAAEIASLEELFASPKIRGGLGEILLEHLLEQVLPPGTWKTNFEIGGKYVEAAVRVGDRWVPIDSKFPVEDFRKLMDAPEPEKEKARKDLVNNLKRRAEEIAEKYIRPDRGTYDFALMYVPAEGVYYETVAFGDFFDYAARLRVFPVSPLTMYLYLTTVALGLRGLHIEEDTKRILFHLSQVEAEIKTFEESFRTIGLHVKNLSGKYEEATRNLTKVTTFLEAVSLTEAKDDGPAGKTR